MPGPKCPAGKVALLLGDVLSTVEGPGGSVLGWWISGCAGFYRDTAAKRGFVYHLQGDFGAVWRLSRVLLKDEPAAGDLHLNKIPGR